MDKKLCKLTPHPAALSIAHSAFSMVTSRVYSWNCFLRRKPVVKLLQVPLHFKCCWNYKILIVFLSLKDIRKLMQLDSDITNLEKDIATFEAKAMTNSIQNMNINSNQVTLNNIKINQAYKNVSNLWLFSPSFSVLHADIFLRSSRGFTFLSTQVCSFIHVALVNDLNGSYMSPFPD